MVAQHHFDSVVIGSGPGGEGAAMMLAKRGQKVAMIEAESKLSEGCTHLSPAQPWPKRIE